MGQSDKVCVICGKSCEGQARIKNAQGQYAHQACVEQKKKGVAPQASKPRVPAEDAGSMAAILSDLGEEDMIGGSQSCQACGYPMDADAMICLHCGFNRETGRQFNTKVARDPNKPTVGGKAVGVGAAAGGMALRPFLPIIGASVGGAIGAVIWGLIAYGTGYEIGYAAIGVGALCGIGACFGGEPETTGGGAIAGVLAAIVAVAAIAGGKYLALEMMYRKYMNEAVQNEEYAELFVVDMEMSKSRFAYDTGRELINDGFEIGWGDPMAFIDAAYWPDDYPQGFQDMVIEKWESLTGGEQQAWKTHVAEEYNEEFGEEFYEEEEAYTADDIDDAWALTEMAETAATTMIEGGETIDWPDKALPLTMLSWPEDFPADLAAEIDLKWAALGDSGQLDYQRDLEHEMEVAKGEARKFADSFAGELKKTALIDSFKHPIQALFLFFAIATAYGIPANND